MAGLLTFSVKGMEYKEVLFIAVITVSELSDVRASLSNFLFKNFVISGKL